MSHTTDRVANFKNHDETSHPVARVEANSSKHQIVRYGDSGVNTVEGNVAGARALRLTQAREAERATYIEQRETIENEERKNRTADVDAKFTSFTDEAETEFRVRPLPCMCLHCPGY
jgi:hypothetical protein